VLYTSQVDLVFTRKLEGLYGFTFHFVVVVVVLVRIAISVCLFVFTRSG
jgi:hypothetical protein